MTSSIEEDRERLQAELARVVRGLKPADVARLAEFIQGHPRVFVTGMGRSGLVAESFAMRLTHVGVPVHVVGEITAPALRAGDALVALSSSGTTATTRARLDRARAVGGHTALVTGRGPAEAAEMVIRLPLAVAGERPQEYESGLVLGGAFEVAAELFTELVVLELVRRAGLSPTDLDARHANLE